MWFVWRQKFMVSCKGQVLALLFEKLVELAHPIRPQGSPKTAIVHCPQPLLVPAPLSLKKCAYLVVGGALEKKDIDHGQLVDESVALKLLPHAGPDGCDGEGDRVHGLDLGRLKDNCC